MAIKSSIQDFAHQAHQEWLHSNQTRRLKLFNALRHVEKMGANHSNEFLIEESSKASLHLQTIIQSVLSKSFTTSLMV